MTGSAGTLLRLAGHLRGLSPLRARYPALDVFGAVVDEAGPVRAKLAAALGQGRTWGA